MEKKIITKEKKVTALHKIKNWAKEHKVEIIGSIIFAGLSGVYTAFVYKHGYDNGFTSGTTEGVWNGIKYGSGLESFDRVHNIHRGWNNDKDEVLAEPTVVNYMKRMGFTPNDVNQASLVLNFELTDDAVRKMNDIMTIDEF